MKISEKDENGITVFVLEGRIDSESSVELEKALQGAALSGKNKMVLEMSGVGYVSSAGLRILADILTLNREKEGDLRLVSLTAKVQRVFEIIGFYKFFQHYDSVLAAMEDY